MSSTRRGISAPKKKYSILPQLKFIESLALSDNAGFKEAMEQMSQIIKRIYYTSFQQTPKYRRALCPKELIAIEALLNLLINKFGRNEEKQHAGRPVVHLLEAHYSTRRGYVEQALGLYRTLERHYPTYAPSYFLHYNLLAYCGRMGDAFEVMERQEINRKRQNLSKHLRAPGAVNIKNLSRLGVSFFSTESQCDDVLGNSVCAIVPEKGITVRMTYRGE